MSIHPNDVVSTLQYLGMLKYWKGKHLILIKQVCKVPFRDHPFTTYAKLCENLIFDNLKSILQTMSRNPQEESVLA